MKPADTRPQGQGQVKGMAGGKKLGGWSQVRCKEERVLPSLVLREPQEPQMQAPSAVWFRSHLYAKLSSGDTVGAVVMGWVGNNWGWAQEPPGNGNVLCAA